MNISCHQSPFIDSIYHIPTYQYNNEQDFQFIGATSVHEHIILNDHCAVITFELDGKTYEFDGDVVCGKFTHAPKIKIVFKNTCQKLTIIRLSSCGMFQLTDTPMVSMVNHIAPGSLIPIHVDADKRVEKYIESLDEMMNIKPHSPSYRLTRDIIRYVNANFAHLPTNATKVVAEYFGISESSLRRYFKKYLGINLSTYIITIKRKKMIQALYENNYDSLSVRENGYYDQSHFLNDFKRLYGVPLKQYFNDIQLLKNQAPDLMHFLYHCNIESAI
ncbi:helix-turn-helix domain-containing protein [Sulfuricurvum sp.]|uniref:helix-turn-helix domain-containing protein n=1 Tax=Sulfuricurvum sp. TaxID=2025608 RepID=UPI003C61A5BE